ncbi:MAG TPA: nuclear transport factor 2 family protein [Nitrospira sp.]|nr:nuclear transport factor 2 family protein [Nitrospira sp.]
MSRSPDDIRDRVDRYFAAWRALDPTAWTACFAADAVGHEPYGATPVQGHAALKVLFHAIAGALQEVTIYAQETHGAHNRAAVLFHGQDIGRNGKPVEVKGIDVFGFNEAGQIQTFWAYWDPAAVLAKLRA